MVMQQIFCTPKASHPNVVKGWWLLQLCRMMAA